MKINPVSNKAFFPADKSVKVNKSEPVSPKDKIEISGMAKSLKSAGQQKIDEVKSRMDSGFYNSDEVISKVADEILKEISGE